MLKPIIILSQMSAAHAGIIGTNIFWRDRGFYPVWTNFDVSKLHTVAEKSELFFLIAPEQGNDQYYTLCHYLRDLCLEEEKTVYQIGNRSSNKYAKSVIPSLFLKGCFLSPEDDLGVVLSRIAEIEKETMERKGFLIISEDVSYCRSMRMALSPYFNVVVTDGRVENMELFLKEATCVLLSLDVKQDFLEMTKLRILLGKVKKETNLHVILLADTREQQTEVTKYLGKEGLCLNKEADYVKNARYLVKRYTQYKG